MIGTLGFLDFNAIDGIDIVLVGIIIYQLYKLTRGTVAIKIFFGILAIYFLWKLVSAFQMEMLGEILGQFIGVGVIALMIVFQQELRQFLLFIGNREFLSNKPSFLQKWFSNKDQQADNKFADSIIRACERMADSKTGALIVVSRSSDPSPFIRSSRKIDAVLTAVLLESIFFKNSPLHDGAVLIQNDRIQSAGGVLPASESDDLLKGVGMRHRAALGMAEQTDAVVVLVSEETGKISYAMAGKLNMRCTTTELRNVLNGGVE